MQLTETKVKQIIWKKSSLSILDQRLIPYEKTYFEAKTYKDIIYAIKEMVLRGAPLIGISAAYGLLLGANELNKKNLTIDNFICELNKVALEIKNSRPTAINLAWAIDLILEDIKNAKTQDEIIELIEKRAVWIHEDDSDRCKKMGEYGSKLISKGAGILTICNTGALATGGIGTAFGVIYSAFLKDSSLRIYASETRPRQQGARLTTFEFSENDIECTLVPDTACGLLMQRGLISMVISGADRIAANGDTANKIGTYQLAVLAKENNIPFYVAAPLSTFDLSIENGSQIPIEERHPNEVTEINGKEICVPGVKVFNPAFDVTPAKYISGIITENGILAGNLKEEIKKFS